MPRRTFAVLAFAAALAVLSPSPALATVGDAVVALDGALDAVSCALELARETLRVGIALAPAAAPCVERPGAAPGIFEANGRSEHPDLSDDGRFVAFNSVASNLVLGDDNDADDVFVYDRATGAIARVSVATDGTGGIGWAAAPSISGDGRFVAFEANGPGLVPGVGWGFRVYVRDRDLSGDGVFDEPGDVATGVVSVGAGGADRSGEEPAINRGGNGIPGGRFVAYRTSTIDINSNEFRHIEIHDRDADGDAIFDEPGATRTIRASVATDGTVGAEGNVAGDAALSADGRCVAFRSNYANLVAGDANGLDDIFVRDRDTDGDGVFDEPGAVRTVRVSVTSAGAEADGRSRAPAISADGRFVAFHSLATNLDPACANGIDQVFVHDRDADADGVFDEPGAIATECLSLDPVGLPGDGPSGRASISPGGRYVVFRSEATNLVGDDRNEVMDVFVHDRTTGETTRVSVASDGTEGDGPSGDLNGGPRVVDAGLVAFGSAATNLAPGDTNGHRDVFVRDPDAAATP